MGKIAKSFERYNSFQELAQVMGISPVKKKGMSEEQITSARNKFCGKCKYCGEYMTWVRGTNVITCTNPDCKGKKNTRSDKTTGEKVAYYTPSYRSLDAKGVAVAMSLFDE